MYEYIKGYKNDLFTSYINFSNLYNDHLVCTNINTYTINNHNINNIIKYLYEFIHEFITIVVKYNSVYHGEILYTNIKRLDNFCQSKNIYYNKPLNIKISISYLRSFIIINKKRNNIPDLQKKYISSVFHKMAELIKTDSYTDIIYIALMLNQLSIVDYFSTIEELEFFKKLNSIFNIKLGNNIKGLKLFKILYTHENLDEKIQSIFKNIE